jgi:hypothetical protein
LAFPEPDENQRRSATRRNQARLDLARIPKHHFPPHATAMKTLTRTALIAVSLLAAGCFPDERLWWSPDGLHLAVLTPAGLQLADPDGDLAEVTCEAVQAAAWLPDGSGLVVIKQTETADWTVAKALVPAAEAKQVEDLAKGIPDLAAALVKATGGDKDQLEPLLESFGIRDLDLLGLALHCALQTQREAMEAALAAHQSTQFVKDLLETKPSFKVNEIAVVEKGGEQALGTPKPVVRSLFPLGVPVPSPKPRLAFTAGPEGPPVPSPTQQLVAFAAGKSLRVAALDGSATLEVTDANLGPCAWTPEGTSLVYLTPLMPPVDEFSLVVAKLCIRRVIGTDGKLLKDPGNGQTPDTCLGATDLATVAVSGPQRLAVLPDGRILFASLAATCPAAPDASEAGEQLFLLYPWLNGAGRPQPVPVDPAVWAGTLQHFVLSPDGKKVAVVDGARDAVAVLELATGKFGIVAPERGRKCRTLPAWRSNDELSFAAMPEETSARPEVMLLQLGQPGKIISGTWQAEILNAMLDKSESPPATE